MANLFAFRATDPAAMKRATDPVGPRNDEFILSMVARAKVIIACWGSKDSFKDRDKEILELLKGYKINALKDNMIICVGKVNSCRECGLVQRHLLCIFLMM